MHRWFPDDVESTAALTQLVQQVDEGSPLARIRNIKPEFFDDPEVGTLSMAARVFFIGLLTQADRRGRLADSPARLKTRIMPFDDVDVVLLLDELQKVDMIRRYSDDKRHHLIWIRSFEKHQRPHPREPESEIAPCLGGSGRVKKRPAVKKNGQPCKKTAGRVETEILETEILETEILETPAAAPPPPPPPPAAEGGFEQFWSAYPNKRGKDDARRAWKKRHPSEALTEIILTAIEAQKSWPQWVKDGRRFIPYPATWLSRGQWDDEPPGEVRLWSGPDVTPWHCPHEVPCTAPSMCEKATLLGRPVKKKPPGEAA